MKPEIYAAIQLEWCKISNEEHRSLMYTYVTKTSNGKKESWMEFLRRHFKIRDDSHQHLPPRSGFSDRISSVV